jgi:hypothetical protein
MGTLTKVLLYTVIPGTPGTPAQPSECSYSGTVQTTLVWVDNGDGTGYYNLVPTTGQDGSLVCTEPVAAVAPTPAIILTNPNIGWTGSAISLESLTGNGVLEFQVPVGSVGVVCGLSESSTTTGYTEIDWAFHCRRGTYRIVENGTPVTGSIAYTDGAKFQVERIGSNIFYLVDGVGVYSSTITTSQTSLLADCSMYFGGDQIVGASFQAVTSAAGSSVGTSTASAYTQVSAVATSAGTSASTGDADHIIGGVTYRAANGASAGTSADTATAGRLVGVSGVSAGTSTDTATARGYDDTAYGTLPAWAGLSSDYAYGEVKATLPSWTSNSGGGLFAEDWGYSNTIFPSWQSYATGLTGGTGTVDVSLPSWDSRSSETVYGEVIVSLPSWTSLAREYYALDAVGDLVIDVDETFNLYGVISSPYFTADLIAPEFTITGYGAGQGELDITFTLTGSGTTTQVGRGFLTFPEFTITGSGKRGIKGDGYLEWSGFSLLGYGASQGRLDFPEFSLSGEGDLGARLRGYLTFPEFTITGSGTVESFMRGYLDFPTFYTIWGTGYLTAPTFSITGSGYADYTAYYSAYATNLQNSGLTEYSGQPFTQVISFQGEYFGFTNNAMYKITGTTFNGTDIDVSAKISATDAGTSRQKRVRDIFIGSDGSDAVIGKVYYDDSFVGHFASQRALSAGTRRAKLPLKGRGRYFSPTIQNLDGGELDVFSVEYFPEILERSA